MLIVPVHKKVTAKNFPTVTFLLVLANCLVFFLFQTDDEQVFEEAIDYYFESKLPEIELPRYQQYLEDTGDSPSAPFLAQEADEGMSDYAWLMYMESDPEFMLALESGEIVTPKEPIYGRWKLLRKRFERILDSSFTQQFLLRYNEVDPVTAFTHMFTRLPTCLSYLVVYRYRYLEIKRTISHGGTEPRGEKWRKNRNRQLLGCCILVLGRCPENTGDVSNIGPTLSS